MLDRMGQKLQVGDTVLFVLDNTLDTGYLLEIKDNTIKIDNGLNAFHRKPQNVYKLDV